MGRHEASRHDAKVRICLSSLFSYGLSFIFYPEQANHEVWALWCSGSFLIPQYAWLKEFAIGVFTKLQRRSIILGEG